MPRLAQDNDIITKMVKEISPTELKQLLDQKPESCCVIDVRRQDEHDYCNIKAAKLITMNEIPERVTEIPRDKTVVIHCHHGGRSRKVIAWLEQAHGFENLVNLDGGIAGWSSDVDPSVPVY